MASFTDVKNEIFEREQRRQQYNERVLGLNAYERHKQFMRDYQAHYGSGVSTGPQQVMPLKTDRDTLRETYRFIRCEEDDLERSWEHRLAKRYHDKLFKEYCIADMSRYKENRIGLRWRTEKEVISGKGQFECGNKKCTTREGLRSYEVNFAYNEAGESKQALVKLRVCPKCSFKLNYRKEKELEKQLRKESRRKKRRLLKEKKREKKGFRERSKSKEKRRGDDNDKLGESPSGSDEEDSDESESSEDVEEARFKRATKRGVLGTVGKASESKDGEFEPYFKDMFL